MIFLAVAEAILHTRLPSFLGGYLQDVGWFFFFFFFCRVKRQKFKPPQKVMAFSRFSQIQNKAVRHLAETSSEPFRICHNQK